MTGKVDTKDAEVDNEHSPIVDRCRFGWTRSSKDWSNNWERDIRYTVFAPVSVLAFYYYERLIHRFSSYVDVNGERYDRITQIYLLGPVCHAIADACVPQHAITAMDFKHQEWEAAIQQWTWGYELEDFNLIRNLLDTHMKRYEYSGGPLRGCLAIDYLVSELCGWKTFVTFLQQNNANNIDTIKSTGFWNGYMSNVAKLKADAKFNYNLAVAATVRVITEACYDVVASGGGSNPDIKIFGVAGYKLVGGVPARKPEPGSPYHVVSRSELPYVRIESVLGFRPDEWRPSASSLFVARDMLTRWTRERLATEQVKEGLAHFEREQLLAYIRARRAGVSRFESAKTISFPAQAQGLRNECGLPAVSANLDIQPTFGLATFRLPTDEELADSDKFAVYLQESEANAINSKLLQVTRCIALSKAFLVEEGSRNRYRRISEAVAGLERLRDFVLRTRSLPPERWPTSDVALQVVSLEAPRSTENVQMVDTA